MEAHFNISLKWTGLAFSPQTIEVPSPRNLRISQQPQQTTKEMVNKSPRSPIRTHTQRVDTMVTPSPHLT